MENKIIIKDESSFNNCNDSESSLIALKLIPEQTEVDNPKSSKNSVKYDDISESILETMKHEENRLSSFRLKWPHQFIRVSDLIRAGFFYLQLDDRVQCAYCRLVLYGWKNGDIPLKMHIKESPTCSFLVTPRDVCGNYNCQVPLSYSSKPSGMPKKPSMTDIRKRIATFETWPLTMIATEELADCGFYYTGVADVVTCFFCGGSLASWEPFDDPMTEHNKFYPNCEYLKLLHNRPIQKKTTVPKPFVPPMKNSKQLAASEFLKSDIIQKAKEIFPSWLVHDVVLRYLGQTGKTFSSLHQLTETILEYEQNRLRMNVEIKDKQSSEFSSCPGTSEAKSVNNANSVNDELLCKICLDRQWDILFQPCGHLIACEKCADLISKCPLCRKPIETKVRTYRS